MKASKGDVVQITFVGRLEDGSVFDLNDTALAKKEGLQGHFHEKTVICVGHGDVVPGLDNALVDLELKKKIEVTVQPEEGFGKRNAELFKMIPLSKFKEHKIQPQPGLQLNIDNNTGIIKSVSGGRVMVDFNHPLAGKVLKYEVTITRKVEDIGEQVQGFLEMAFHMHGVRVEEKEGAVTVKFELPEQLQKIVEETLKKRNAKIQSVSFKK
jgi:FKBP-type peptidyl-prolyl cis-trans isomerase 2